MRVSERPFAQNGRSFSAGKSVSVAGLIDEIKRASIDDGKDIHDHVRVDMHMPRRGRVRKALELLDKAHHDVAQEEDDPNTRGLQERALHHIDEAHHTVEHIVHSWD